MQNRLLCLLTAPLLSVAATFAADNPPLLKIHTAIEVELERDGELLYTGEHRPAGLWDDGPATVYARFDVPAGPQSLTVRMRDSGRAEGFDYERTETVDLVPEQNLVIGFDTLEGLVIR